ncbi:uncharacterized protein N7518_007043 [Penicillium psychrosexuale]|uniref:uncharacterized protein n=1 Tax=Penicillium psychrosexuale TaxID=1002107 RepID=UPI0025453C5C|nr:uncharacterized protein N7518_007043 [Penicillium psychrosexuale]KAJ5790032.1 hypothetical protein N7518_007043 [Penicillium psychrosexuale]
MTRMKEVKDLGRVTAKGLAAASEPSSVDPKSGAKDPGKTFCLKKTPSLQSAGIVEAQMKL